MPSCLPDTLITTLKLGGRMLHVFSSILPIFIVMALGVALRRGGILQENFVKSANNLVFRVCLPILLFYKISHARLNGPLPLVEAGIMIAAMGLLFAVLFPLTAILTGDRRTAGTLAMNAFRGNFAYLGLPVSYYLFGDPGLTTASLFLAVLVPVVNTLAVISLNMGAAARLKLKPLVKSTVLNPLFVACVLGLAWLLLPLPLPGPVDESLSIIAPITLPLALLCIGAGLKWADMGLNRKRVWVGALAKLLVLPALGFAWLWFRGGPIELADRIMMIMLASPSALVNYVMADAMDGDPDLSTGIIIFTTVGSVFTYVFWMSLTGMGL